MNRDMAGRFDSVMFASAIYSHFRREEAEKIEREIVAHIGTMDDYRKCRDAADGFYTGPLAVNYAALYRVACKRALRRRKRDPKQFGLI